MSARLLVLLVAVSHQLLAVRGLNLTSVPCGRPQLLASGPRIVGGAATFPGQLPWTVSIQMGSQHFCGGTLITQRHVLSAAHCFHGRQRTAFSVMVGEHDLKVTEASQQRHAIQHLTVHDDYKSPSYRNDIALLRLAEDVTFGLFAQPACLPASDAAAPEGDAVVAGWGWLDEYRKGGKRADVLQRAQAPVQARAECNRWFTNAGKSITLKDGQLCAGYEAGGKDACQGDSGGPLVAQDGEEYTLVGVVSAGIGCARASLPGIYTDVRRYVKWIQQRVAADE